jgi:DNA repair exonuclease SbcCD ATPase subunit
MQLTFANRDHESMTQAFSTLQRQHDTLVSQQDHWDELHRATQQMETLSSRLNHADNEEMKELRRIRDRHQLLETEYTALQRKAREQDTKIVNNERALLTARQSLTAANQRSAEWERRAKESEGKYDMTQTQLDQLEQTHAQLEADHTLAGLQLEEKEAEERLLKVNLTSHVYLVAHNSVGPREQVARTSLNS